MNASDDRKAILARFGDGPAHLDAALAGLAYEDLDARPTSGGWTIREIVHHVADGDDLWKAGIKAALGNEQGEFTLSWYWSLPQDAWVERWAYADRSLAPSLALLRAARAHVLQLLEHLADGWERSIAVRRPDGEILRLTVGEIVEMQADHVEHHVKRILAIRDELGHG
jgi:uncharacterized damage-inducible protein DinB